VKALVICEGGGIGDVLFATPVIRALRRRFERIVALTSPLGGDVLVHDPELDEVWLDDDRFDRVCRRIAQEAFDAAIVTWATLRSAALPFVAGIPIRVGQARRPYSALFSHRVVVRSELGDRTTHWTQILLDYARAIGCDTDEPSPTFRVTNDERGGARRILSMSGVREGYFVFHPSRGITGERRAWPSGHLGAIAGAIAARHQLRPLITGAGRDRAAAEEAARAAGGPSIAGLTTLGEFGGVCEGAEFVVAMDSGPMHIAAAVGTPTLGIFAMQPDEPDRWRPLGPHTAIVRPVYPCPPNHRKESCPDFACVAQLQPQAVLEALDGLLIPAGETPTGAVDQL